MLDSISKTVVSLMALVALSMSVAACGGGDGDAPSQQSDASAEAKVEITEEAREQAEQIYDTRCVTCHGESGKGDGPGSAGLSPKPADLSMEEWQKSVTDEHIETVILSGGAGVGKSPAMPPNPDLRSKPAVVGALVELVRSFEE